MTLDLIAHEKKSFNLSAYLLTFLHDSIRFCDILKNLSLIIYLNVEQMNDRTTHIFLKKAYKIRVSTN